MFRHAFIAGHGSFLYWLPVKGSGSFLVMQPQEGTTLEFFTATDMDYAHGRERFTVFVAASTALFIKRRRRSGLFVRETGAV